MFNLIVSGSGWQPHRDSFGSGRVLEYTDAAVVQRFMQNKVLDINAVSKLPTLGFVPRWSPTMLTDKHCKNALCPADKKRARFTDSGGLYLEVSPAGSKRWFWKTYADGKEGRLALGGRPASDLVASCLTCTCPRAAAPLAIPR